MLTTREPSGFDAIKTYVRIRPSPANELKPANQLLSVHENTIQIDQKISFSFDFVGGEVCTQQQVFDAVGKPLCQHAMEGYNATLFCYGQTGSGKTFTMQGPPEGSKDKNQRGLMQRTFEVLIYF
jgi:chromosomal replication initiation ATPase DnaA